ncbi:MAG: hypothetical protein H0V96_05165, partial [Acidimicrobiia bacterium]|nr:hypothetical protein [Acidimicrobiia bacterium]
MRKRTRAVLTTMILALSGLVFVAPAAADDYFLEYDLSEGAFLTPGTILPVDSETLDEPAGAECLVTIESINGLSVHLGNNLVLLHNGTPVA